VKAVQKFSKAVCLLNEDKRTDVESSLPLTQLYGL